ncbi:MAG: putative lipid II flippase FtsW [Lachnospiraceae bacterium]
MATKQAVKRKKKKQFHIPIFKNGFLDYSLLFVIIFLVSFGLVMVYSTSSYSAQLNLGNPTYYLKRQAISALIGFAGMLIVTNMDYHWWKKWTLIMMYGILALLVLTLIMGTDSHGATRWLNIGGMSLQPSEMAKIVIILFTAHMSTLKAARIGDFKIMLKVAAFPMVAVVLIAKENLSTAIICAAITLVIIFVTSPKVKQFVYLGLIVLGLLVIFLLVASYRLERIKIWLHPEDYDKGYQTLQALYAIGSGGLFGKGLGQSIQKLGFIPESHNDMIFSVICEELGLFGAICVILLFALLIWRCVMIAMSAPDLYGSLIVVGVITHIAVQVIVNIAVVTNTFPPTGVPLPFISYGGTALCMLLVELGLVLSVAKQINMPKEY